MTWQKKVVWSAGMFLKPQHFQQQERYFEFFAHARSLPAESFFWGFRDLVLDAQALALGKVLIASAEGVFPDGTPFQFPAQGIGPEALEVPANMKGARIVLALPIRRSDADEVAFEDKHDSLARYRVNEKEAHDTNSIRATPSVLQLADLRLRLLPESELSDGWLSLGVARVAERRPDNQIVLDNEYIPPTLSCGRQEVLRGYIDELLGLLHQRADALAGRLSQAGRGGVSEVADFLMLELLNRWEPLLRHLAHTGSAHPERLYALLLQLAGDLATFFKEGRRPAAFPDYAHDDLHLCFHPLMRELRASLSMVMERNAIQIDLQERNYGVRVGVMPSAELVRSATFVLAAHADIPAESMRSNVPTQVKVGPVERIRDLVNLHLPGVALRPLPLAPRQIPYNAGYQYFELDTGHDLWKQMPQSGGLAIHVAGDFPGLRLELWAIRQ